MGKKEDQRKSRTRFVAALSLATILLSISLWLAGFGWLTLVAGALLSLYYFAISEIASSGDIPIAIAVTFVMAGILASIILGSWIWLGGGILAGIATGILGSFME